MKAGYVIRDQEKPHFVTTTVVDWIDIFTRKTYRDIIINCFDFCIKNKGMVLFGYVIMSNHMHLIVQSKEVNFPILSATLKNLQPAKSLNNYRPTRKADGNEF